MFHLKLRKLNLSMSYSIQKGVRGGPVLLLLLLLLLL